MVFGVRIGEAGMLKGFITGLFGVRWGRFWGKILLNSALLHFTALSSDPPSTNEKRPISVKLKLGE